MFTKTFHLLFKSKTVSQRQICIDINKITIRDQYSTSAAFYLSHTIFLLFFSFLPSMATDFEKKTVMVASALMVSRYGDCLEAEVFCTEQLPVQPRADVHVITPQTIPSSNFRIMARVALELLFFCQNNGQ